MQSFMNRIVLAAGLALAASGAAEAQAPRVQVDHAAARLVVIAEPRRDISVVVSHGASRLPPLTVRQEGGRIVVDGGLGGPFLAEHISCRGGVERGPFGVRDTRAVVTDAAGRTSFADLPVVTAHVPLDAHVASGGAVWGEVGATHSLDLASHGCGDWNAGPVQGPLTLALAGSGDVHASDVGSLRAGISGSSTVTVGHVRGGADVQIGGSGDLKATSISGTLHVVISGSGNLSTARLDGPVRASMVGSGDVRLQAGRAPDVQVQTAGSGSFVFGGQAGRVAVSAVGSGDVRIAHATGPVSRTSTGSADIDIGR